MFQDIQVVPRFKDEFETTAVFRERQASAVGRLSKHYLIEAPVDTEHVRYDADRKLLIVATYALTNTSADLDPVFGYTSELHAKGVTVAYRTGDVAWPFPFETTNVGTYEGTNAYGAKVQVLKEARVSRGVFEREGAYDETIWYATPKPYDKASPPIAFEIAVDAVRAKALKDGGLRAAILVVPKPPYHATGVRQVSPRVGNPLDCTIDLRFLVGDIQCAALYDAKGELLAIRATR